MPDPTSYAEFLARKQSRIEKPGREVVAADVHSMLHPWQNELVRWAVRTGRAALWADTGMGKTVMQLEWARLSAPTSLVVAPLAVCQQTVREAAKLGIEARYIRHHDAVDSPGIYVTNYEQVPNMLPDFFGAVVLDESSILKQSDGKTRTMLIAHFRDVPYRLACSATPAPNDPEELTNQAEWLGRMTRTHMLAAYFIHDQDGWRLKKHARRPMMQWMAQWAVAITKPSDVGGDDTGYMLPGLEVVPEIVHADIDVEGQLFATEIGGVTGRSKVRRSTLKARVDRAVELVYDCTASQRSGVYEGVLRSQQAQVETIARTAHGPQRKTEGTLRERCGVSGSHEPSSSGIAQATSTATACLDVRALERRDRADDRCGMRDLPCESACRLDGEDSHRPRSHDGHDPRCTLSTVQSGARSLGRRSDSSNGDVRLHHACRDQWVIWCGLNDEQDALAKALGDDARSIDGRTPIEDRVSINEAWIAGDFRVLLVKPGMYSYGMNWQHCARMAFVGLGDSYEQYYQAIRRCYRYGQTRIVQAHVVLSELESQIAANVARKETQANQITRELVAEMRRVRSALSVSTNVNTHMEVSS